jgi:hypothetical protein
MESALPAGVFGFVTAYVRNLDELHLLLALMHASDRWWDANSAARELNLTPQQAAAGLDHLARHNLLDIRIAGTVRYQFLPGNQELRDAAAACLEAYRRNPMALLQVVTGSARRSIRDFADAFRIRGNDDR